MVHIHPVPSTLLCRSFKGSIPCEHDDISYYTVLWYQQKKGAERQLQLVATSLDVNSAEMEKEFKTRFNVTRPATLYTSLTINPGMVEDTAVYFCALCNNPPVLLVPHNTRKVGLNITSPRVAIFPPSKQEIKEKGKATLVCLATKFYPDHIKLFWEVNDRKEGVRTDESLMDKTKKKYSLTSRLRISRQEWSNPKNVFQCRVEFYGIEKQTYDEVISGVAGEY
uniref:Ig-like domain-containing protein n=1 Tax=Terrapene triunguis TaxID=2587831 RepID=A0A674ILZ2_9SAUR